MKTLEELGLTIEDDRRFRFINYNARLKDFQKGLRFWKKELKNCTWGHEVYEKNIALFQDKVNNELMKLEALKQEMKIAS